MVSIINKVHGLQFTVFSFQFKVYSFLVPVLRAGTAEVITEN